MFAVDLCVGVFNFGLFVCLYLFVDDIACCGWFWLVCLVVVSGYVYC